MEISGNPRGRSSTKSAAQAINISQELRKSSPGPGHGKHTESSSTVPRAASSSTQPTAMNEPTKRKATSIDHSSSTFKKLKTSNSSLCAASSSTPKQSVVSAPGLHAAIITSSTPQVQEKFEVEPKDKSPIFKHFTLLPAELRIMTWKYALPSRTSIDHTPSLPSSSHSSSYYDDEYSDSDSDSENFNLPVSVSRKKNIKESVPGVLNTCYESRELLLPLYRTNFAAPQFAARPTWSYTGSLNRYALEDVALDLFSAPTDFSSCCDSCAEEAMSDFESDLFHQSKKEILSYINEFMNRHRKSTSKLKFNNFASLAPKEKCVLCPAWFAEEKDVLYLRRPVPSFGGNIGFCPGCGLLKPLSNPIKSSIQLSNSNYNLSSPGWNPNYRPRLWAEVAKCKRLTGLKRLTLVLLHDREVLHITMDEKGVVNDGQWSFALNTTSTSFKSEMGCRGSGITWNIILASPSHPSLPSKNAHLHPSSSLQPPPPDAKKQNPGEPLGLWELARQKWRPNRHQWESDKRTICRGIVEENKWWAAKRVHNWSTVYPRSTIAVEGGGGGTTGLVGC